MEGAEITGSTNKRTVVPETLYESRVIFDEDIRWSLSKENTDNILRRIKKSGFNVYVVNVWHGKGTYYPSKFGHLDARVAKRIQSGEDPLEYLITKAHELGIEVHIWFTVIKREDNRYPGFFDEGTPPGAFNVHNEKFRKFMANMMSDAASRYEVDGVNFDYIRSMGICDSAFCKDDYFAKTGHSLTVDKLASRLNQAARDRIESWLDAAVYDLVKRSKEGIKNANDQIIISVDGQPRIGKNARPLEGRHESEWLESGLVDIVYNMDYRIDFDGEAYSAARNQSNKKEQFIFIFGNYDRVGKNAVARDPKHLIQFVEHSRKHWPGSGVAFYLYNLLSDDQIDALSSTVFSTSAIPCWSRCGR